MAFTYTKDLETVEGNLRITGGTFTSTAGTQGGDIVTGLSQVLDMQLTAYGSSVVADAPTVNASGGTSPLTTTGKDNGTLTIITTATTAGRWLAFGA